MNDGNKQKLNGHKKGRFNDEFRLGTQSKFLLYYLHTYFDCTFD